MSKIKPHKQKQEGGKILGIGADGCVFSDASWPCEDDLPGYDPSDPAFVSKLVKTSDNEDDIIRFAQSIVPDKKQHLIEFIGTCSPANKLTVVEPKKKEQVVDNREALIRVHESYIDEHPYYSVNNEDSNANACVKLAEVKSENFSEYIKILANKRYRDTLFGYIEKHKNDPSQEILIKSAFEFVKVLERLAKGPDRRLINVDLHAANIFMNDGPIMGMADFGRCAIYDSNVADNKKLLDYILEYTRTYDITFGYTVIPFELKLFSYIIGNIRQINREKLNETDIIKDFVLRMYQATEDIKKTTPLSIIVKYEDVELFLMSYFKPFVRLMLDDYTNKIRDPTNKTTFWMFFFLERFHTIGFLQTLLNALSKTKVYKDYYKDLETGMLGYLLRNEPYKYMKTDIYKLMKLYFDTLIYPHKMIKYASIETPTYKDYVNIIKARKTTFSQDMDNILNNADSELLMVTTPPRRPVLPPARSLMRTLMNPPPTLAAVVNAPPIVAPPNNKTKATLNALRARPQTRATVKAIMNLTRKQQVPNMYVPPSGGGTKTRKARRRKF